jgi:hypothetical protein
MQNRRVGWPTLPTEIVWRILSASRYIGGDATFPPGPEIFDDQDGDYTYRYTRFALKARRVCRLWRDIVDIPSNYWSRVSTAALNFDIDFEIDVNSTGPSGNVGAWVRTILIPWKNEKDKFQEVISLSRKSLLVLRLDIPAGPLVIQRDGGKQSSNGGGKDVQNCFNPAANRSFFEDRIIQLVMGSTIGKYQDSLPEIVESFACESISRLSLCWGHASMARGSELISEETGISEANLRWIPRETPRETPLLQLKYLEHLSLRTNQKINELCHLPPFVTDLRLDGDDDDCSHVFVSELRLVLGDIGSQLKTLSAAVYFYEAATNYLPPNCLPIRLPKLTSITLGRGPVNFTNFLLGLDCPKLEKASVMERNHPRDNISLSQRVNLDNPQVELPALKMLQIVSHGERTSLPLEAFSMPYLQSLSVIEKGDSETVELDELSLPICKRLSALSLRSLHIHSKFNNGGVLLSFLKHLNSQTIEELYINHPSILAFFECFPKSLMLQSRYLELAQPNCPTVDPLNLDQIVFGKNLATLRLNSPFVNSRDMQKLHGIRTLILAEYWGESISPINNKLDPLLHLCPNLTSLCFTHRHRSEFRDVMAALCPTSCNPLVPKLQHLTVELGDVLDNVDDWRPMIMEILSIIGTARRNLGAKPLLSVTIAILRDAYEKPEVIEYPPESEGGILCRILLADEQRLPSNLFTEDQIHRER